jgi:hypothetical protein
MRISAKVRAEAIEACLALADVRIRDTYLDDEDYPTGLARAAWEMAAIARPDAGEPVADECAWVWLEAAALLRGDDEHHPWSPGDPVYLLTTRGPRLADSEG